MIYYINVYIDKHDVIWCCLWLMIYYMNLYVDKYDVTW